MFLKILFPSDHISNKTEDTIYSYAAPEMLKNAKQCWVMLEYAE